MSLKHSALLGGFFLSGLISVQSLAGDRVIYGEDNRQDIYQVDFQPHLKLLKMRLLRM